MQSAGLFDCGLPFHRPGRGRRIYQVMQGLVFEYQPLTGMASLQNRSLFSLLEKEYAIHVVARKPGLPCQSYELGQGWFGKRANRKPDNTPAG